jgi:hypothetical protein
MRSPISKLDEDKSIKPEAILSILSLKVREIETSKKEMIAIPKGGESVRINSKINPIQIILITKIATELTFLVPKLILTILIRITLPMYAKMFINIEKNRNWSILKKSKRGSQYKIAKIATKTKKRLMII